MGKAALCLRMLQILNTGRVYKVSELAELLETNPRNIIEYKKELDEISAEAGSGFYIESIPGRYGGYRLNGSITIPSLRLKPEEKDAIIHGLDYLCERPEFMYSDSFITGIGKCLFAVTMDDVSSESSLIINRFPLIMEQREVERRYRAMEQAIKDHRVVEFGYLSSKNALKQHVFQPYELFMYNNSWFVIGWIESHNDICWFKINRIRDIRITDRHFRVWSGYKKSDYLDEFGFKTNGEWYHIKFIAYGNYAALVQERVYGKNQVVTVLDEHSTQVEVDMQNMENIIPFLMGFSKFIKILEPEEIKKEIAERIETLRSNIS